MREKIENETCLEEKFVQIFVKSKDSTWGIPFQIYKTWTIKTSKNKSFMAIKNENEQKITKFEI